MSIQKSFRVLGRIRLDETRIRMRHVQAEIVETYLLATDVAVGFAEINLSVPRAMCQRHEHLLLPIGYSVDVLPHQGIATTIAVLVTQPFTDTYRRMALLHMDLLVGFQNGINDGSKRRQCRRN